MYPFVRFINSYEAYYKSFVLNPSCEYEYFIFRYL